MKLICADLYFDLMKYEKKHSTREGYVDNKAPEVKMFSSPFTLTTGHTMS